MDLSSRLRAIVKGTSQTSGGERTLPATRGELTYEPDTGRYEATIDLAQIAAVLGGHPVETPHGRCLIVDRRYEADRWHGSIKIGDCEVQDRDALTILDPALGRGQTPVV